MRCSARRRWIALLVVLLATACAPRSGGAGADASAPAPASASAAAPAAVPTSDAALAKVVIAYSSIAGDYTPLWVTAETGLFARHGLDVEVTYIASGTTAMQS